MKGRDVVASSILDELECIRDKRQSLSLSFHGADNRKTRVLLLVMHTLLPSVPDMKNLVETFLEGVDGVDDVVGSSIAHQHLKRVLQYKESLLAQPDALCCYDTEQLQQTLYSCALCMIFFATASAYYRHIIQPLGRTPIMDYIHVSLNVLATLNVYQEPNILFVLIVALLLMHFMYALRPSVAAELLYQAMNVSVMLGLHHEPSALMAFDEAKRRVRWYALLCASDWDLTSVMERQPILPMDKTRFPSIFGTDEDRSRYLPPSLLGRLLCARLSFRTTNLLRCINGTNKDTDELHQDILNAMALFQRFLDTSTADKDQQPLWIRTKFGIASLHYLLIRLHVPYYVRAWNDEQFSMSKKTCFESALFLLHLFRDVFQSCISAQNAGANVSSLSQMANYFQFASRWCCSSCTYP
ncbi:hypothetical protein MNAN1_003772 [Malassezia nana]|uniref:Transcription factor domain-containing protein n=1 Tax=Malassezia nana TaxID=180528 RepID=A0AAF0EQE8_9BASI|nr:hypothetical protein MNAN1_003772 [Malassezia nana]